MSTGLAARPDVGAVHRTRGRFVKEFIDDPQTFALTTTTSRAHGLGEVPKMVSIVLTCTNTANSYTAGDQILLSAGNTYGGLQGGGFAVQIDNANVQIHWSSNLMVVRTDTYSDQNFLDPADWTVTISAWT